MRGSIILDSKFVRFVWNERQPTLRIAMMTTPDLAPKPKPGYDWSGAGEEWSGPWGTSEAQWYGTIFPRIHRFLPAPTILEIASGFGRWTHYLKAQCELLHAVDRVEKCIDACRRRFAADAHVRCYVNDGRSLAMVPDGTVDFVFSFDSLVHVRREIIEAYLMQLATKLTPDGVCFLHHSNFGEYSRAARKQKPGAVKRFLTRAKIIDTYQHRSPDMTAELFREISAGYGLSCIAQEIINWRGRRLIDCLSTITLRGSKWDRPVRLVRNPAFMKEAQLVRRWSDLYASPDRSP
jgi:SAM-dependent methyltransferase